MPGWTGTDDGVWDPTGEKVEFNHNATTYLTTGVNTLTFTIPSGLASTGAFSSFMRFRFSTTGKLSDGSVMAPTGLASDGEVEDYQVSVIPEPGTVAGTVWNDIDGDGSQTAGEPGLANWTVYVDVDNDGIQDGGEPYAISDSVGSYSIPGVPPGTYALREVLQLGWSHSHPVVAPDLGFYSAVDVFGGQFTSGMDFGNLDVRPTVTINQGAAQGDPTGTSPIVFTAVFSAPVTDFGVGDVTLSGTAGATTVAVSNPSGDHMTYTVTVSGMTNTGTVIASIASDMAHDAAGNPNAPSTSTDNSVQFLSRPTVTINQASGQADPTRNGPIVFTVVFSQDVQGFTTADPGDVVLGGTAGASAFVISQPNPSDFTTYTVTVSGMTRTGTVTASIPAHVAQDTRLVTLDNLASTSTDNSVVYDVTAPTVTINQATTQADPATSSPILFTVTFSEAVSGFTSSAITLGGTAGATTAVITGTGPTYSVAVSGMARPGTVTATILAGAVQDLAGNANLAATSTDNTVTYAPAAPTVTINQAVGQVDPTTSNVIHFTVAFSSPVNDFNNVGGDVNLSASNVGGVITYTVSPTDGTGKNYDVTVTLDDSAVYGTVVATIPAGVAPRCVRPDQFGRELHRQHGDVSAGLQSDDQPGGHAGRIYEGRNDPLYCGLQPTGELLPHRRRDP